MNIPYGYCHCGCGEKTKIVDRNSPKEGYLKGEPRRFIGGHNRHFDGVTPEERFWAKVDKRGPDDCWPWTGSTNKQWGYGHIYYKGKVEQAHRVSWMINRGTIPVGMKILHKCDNPPCCNDAHHFIGTDMDNAQDKINKNRQKNLKGEDHPNAKFTNQVIIHIRTSNLSNQVLAKLYNTDHRYISEIRRHKIWKHLL